MKAKLNRSLPTLPSAGVWDKQWRKHWSTTGAPGYESPSGDTAERGWPNQARTPDKEKARLTQIQDEFIRAFKGLYKVGPAVAVFGSARYREPHPYYEMARAVGAELENAGFATLTGGGQGRNIILPHEHSANPSVDSSIEFRYFFTRTVCLVKYSCAYIVMPGGLGTLDEMLEAATLIQCGRTGPFPLILMGEQFWDRLRQSAPFMMAEGVFARNEIDFGYVTDSPKKAVELIVRGLHQSVRKCLQPSRTDRST